MKQRVLDAFLLVMRPVVKILLRYGISFSEFNEVAKTAFVDVASSEFGIRGRPTNISRVAVMTGLTRKEVRRLRNRIEERQEPVSVKTTPISEILTRWHAEKENFWMNAVDLPLCGFRVKKILFPSWSESLVEMFRQEQCEQSSRELVPLKKMRTAN